MKIFVVLLILTVFSYCYGASCNSTSCLNGGYCNKKCICTTNYTGSSCETFNYCAYYSQPCVAPYVCINNMTLDNYTCECSKGWTGTNCSSPVDYCSQSPCLNNGTCTNVFLNYPTYICLCPIGYIGTNCTYIDYCFSAIPICLNGGTCVSTSTGFTCQCKNGFIGATCNKLKPAG